MCKKLLPLLVFFLVLASIGIAQRNPHIDKTPNHESAPVDRKPGPVYDPPREHPGGHPDRHPRPITIEQPARPISYQPPEAVAPVESGPDSYYPVWPHPDTQPDVYVDIDINYINYYDIDIYLERRSTKMEAIDLFENEDYFGALSEFITAIDEHPDDYILYLYRARTNIKLANYEWAIEDLDYFVKAYPEDKEISFFRDALYYRGLAKYHNNDADGAYSDFNYAIEMGDLKAKLFLKKYF